MKRKFTGYRSHPTYIERVTNFLNHIQSSTDESKQTQSIVEEQENEEFESTSLNFQPPQPTTTLLKGKQQQNNTYTSQSSKQIQQPVAQQQPVQQRKITTSDLRNKRNQVVSNTYRPVAPSQGRKANPTYSVKMAFGSGAYQMDSY
jgi:hypothetical protein